jgi:MbtH protein
MRRDDEDTEIYEVVMNDEEQYSIWLKEKPVPAGWQTVGKSGLKTECLAHIEEVWTDMRPLSLRKHMAEYEAARARAARDGVSIPSSAGGVPSAAQLNTASAPIS